MSTPTTKSSREKTASEEIHGAGDKQAEMVKVVIGGNGLGYSADLMAQLQGLGYHRDKEGWVFTGTLPSEVSEEVNLR